MGGILAGLRVVEASAFVAAPLGGMTLAQLGADVVRVDPLGGGLDARRWPLAPDGTSLFWAGLNRGKRSVRLDLSGEAGRDLARALVAAGGADGGILLTNLPLRGWLDEERLRAARPDAIVVVLEGNRDGSSEVDYTVNPATGFPSLTGPRGSDIPVASVVPAWDIALGGLAALAVLAAERHRARTGAGQTVRIALSDVAFAMAANLGRLGQAALAGPDEPEPAPDGNHLYGAYGADVVTRDGRRLMLIGLTPRQWSALVAATGAAEAMAALAARTGEELADEGARFRLRDAITAELAPWFAARDLADVAAALDAAGVAWGPFQTFREALADPRVAPGGLFATVDHPGVGLLPTPGSPLRFDAVPPVPPMRAPLLGEHTLAVLEDVLGLAPDAVRALVEAGVARGA